MWSFLTSQSKKSHLINQAFEEMSAMLAQDVGLVSSAITCLTAKAPPPDVASIEERINSSERMIRRLILEHLTLNPDHDLSASLGLLSVVHDVERIGDYAKSIVEIAGMAPELNMDTEVGRVIGELSREVPLILQSTLDAFSASDAAIASEVMARHRVVKERTDTLLGQVVADSDSGCESVVLAVVSRYLRRISAHASNVASSIVNPLDLVSRNEVGVS
jgi:phosphate uptake regulator